MRTLEDIGRLAVASVAAERSARKIRWKDCRDYEPAEPEVGYGGSHTCPDREMDSEEWCPSCREKARRLGDAGRARRRLLRAILDVEPVTPQASEEPR